MTEDDYEYVKSVLDSAFARESKETEDMGHEGWVPRQGQEVRVDDESSPLHTLTAVFVCVTNEGEFRVMDDSGDMFEVANIEADDDSDEDGEEFDAGLHMVNLAMLSDSERLERIGSLALAVEALSIAGAEASVSEIIELAEWIKGN